MNSPYACAARVSRMFRFLRFNFFPSRANATTNQTLFSFFFSQTHSCWIHYKILEKKYLFLQANLTDNASWRQICRQVSKWKMRAAASSKIHSPYAWKKKPMLHDEIFSRVSEKTSVEHPPERAKNIVVRRTAQLRMQRCGASKLSTRKKTDGKINIPLRMIAHKT